MWLKLPSPSGPHMWPLSESGGNLFVGGGYDTPPGIYSGNMPNLPEYQPCEHCGGMNGLAQIRPTLLLRFGSTEHAAESLSNLFKSWAGHRQALYLIPVGNDWLTELEIEKRKEKQTT